MKNDLLHPARPDATRSESDAATAAAAAASGDDAVTAAAAPFLPPEDSTGFPEGAAAPDAGSAIPVTATITHNNPTHSFLIIVLPSSLYSCALLTGSRFLQALASYRLSRKISTTSSLVRTL